MKKTHVLLVGCFLAAFTFVFSWIDHFNPKKNTVIYTVDRKLNNIDKAGRNNYYFVVLDSNNVFYEKCVNIDTFYKKKKGDYVLFNEDLPYKIPPIIGIISSFLCFAICLGWYIDEKY